MRPPFSPARSAGLVDAGGAELLGDEVRGGQETQVPVQQGMFLDRVAQHARLLDLFLQ
jgi:hypothetical protein